jgi:hypothetical protein
MPIEKAATLASSSPVPVEQGIENAFAKAIAKLRGVYVPHEDEEQLGPSRHFREFACGRYGCVYPTNTPGIVFKITRDESEAKFVTAAPQLGDWPRGITKYMGVYRLTSNKEWWSDLGASAHAWVLWREEVIDTGRKAFAELDRTAPASSQAVEYLLNMHRAAASVARGLNIDAPDLDVYREAIRRVWIDTVDVGDRVEPLIDGSREMTRRIFNSDLENWILSLRRLDEMHGSAEHDPSSIKRAKDRETRGQTHYVRDRMEDALNFFLQFVQQQDPIASLSLSYCASERLAEWMLGTRFGALVGDAHLKYQHGGMLLADIHGGNVGLALRDEIDFVITDPGHMVPFEDRFIDIQTEMLPTLAGGRLREDVTRNGSGPFIGAFIGKQGRAALLAWWNQAVGIPVLGQKWADHMTILFAPTDEELAVFPIGNVVTMRVVGWAADDKGQAVVVQPDLATEKEHPHITVATAPGVGAVYSNELLARGFTPVDGPVLQGKIKLGGKKP